MAAYTSTTTSHSKIKKGNNKNARLTILTKLSTKNNNFIIESCQNMTNIQVHFSEGLDKKKNSY